MSRSDILPSHLKAMRECVLALPVAPVQVYVDGTQVIPGLDVDRGLVRGDGVVPEVSAASIVAKFIHDRIMHVRDRVWPAYRFASHKGYGTQEHMRALSRHGPCPVHRFSFPPVRRGTDGLRPGAGNETFTSK